MIYLSIISTVDQRQMLCQNSFSPIIITNKINIKFLILLEAKKRSTKLDHTQNCVHHLGIHQSVYFGTHSHVLFKKK